MATKKSRLELSPEKIERFCKEWKVRELSIFGSALRDDFTDQSDIDLLITFDDQVRYSLFDLAHMEKELRDMFKRNVDLVSRRGVESSRNLIRRKNILNSAQIIYAA